jgi:NRPS condensation-like uncharacterized protein
MALLTEQEINTRLDEVKKIQFFLEPDPLKVGLQTLLVKLAEIQIQKNRVSYLITEAMQNNAKAEIEKEAAQSEYNRNLELNLTDPQVAAQKSTELRNTHAKLKMPELVLKLHHADIASIQANWYMKILSSIYSNLESANSNLSRQISVIQLENNISNGNVGNPQNRGVIKQMNF